MLVLCTGMKRSGSTWSFHVVKQLLARTSSTVCAGYCDAVGEPLRLHAAKFDHVVVKTHTPDVVGRGLIKQRACRTIYTYREPLHSILSVMEAFAAELDEQTDALKVSLDLMRYQVEAGGVLFVCYDDIVTRTQDVVQAISGYLDLALPPEAIADIATVLSRENVRKIIANLGKSRTQTPTGGAQWDGGTLFSDHHVRANPSDPLKVFSAAQIAGIAKRLSPYVDADAVLRPEIRAIGSLDGPPSAATCWPEPAAPPVEAVAVEVPAIEAPPVEAVAVEAPPVEAPPAEASPVEASPVEAAEPAAALPAEMAAEPPEAPSIDDAAEPPEAPPADAPAAAPEAPPAAGASPPKLAATGPSAPPATPPATPKSPSYDPSREAARKALARDLLRSLGRAPAGKPRLPGASR